LFDAVFGGQATGWVARRTAEKAALQARVLATARLAGHPRLNLPRIRVGGGFLCLGNEPVSRSKQAWTDLVMYDDTVDLPGLLDYLNAQIRGLMKLKEKRAEVAARQAQVTG
jgi:hypothetical protein